MLLLYSTSRETQYFVLKEYPEYKQKKVIRYYDLLNQNNMTLKKVEIIEVYSHMLHTFNIIT